MAGRTIVDRLPTGCRWRQFRSASLKNFVPDTVSVAESPVLRQLVQVDAGGHRGGAAELRALAAGHRGQIGLAAEFPALIDEVAQRLLVGEDEDQAILVHAESQPALHLHHLHERLALRALVDDHALAGGAAGEEELDAERAEHGVAGRAARWRGACRARSRRASPARPAPSPAPGCRAWMILPSFGTPSGSAFCTSFSGSQENTWAATGGDARHTATANIARCDFMSFPFECRVGRDKLGAGVRQVEIASHRSSHLRCSRR